MNFSVAEKREHLFEIYSANLTAFFPNIRNVFVCPLCFHQFDRDVLQYDDILTLEHCIPSAIGGKLETLTCGECNNNQGSWIDAHLASKQRSEDSILGLNGTPLKGKIIIGDAEVQARITFTADRQKVLVQFVQKASHPDTVKAVIKEITEKGQVPDGLHFSLNWSMGYTKRRYEVALLRAAYLALFNCFGYRYASREFSSLIRQQIVNPDDVIIQPDYILGLDSGFAAWNCVTVLVEPVEIRGFLIPIKSASKHRATITGVLVPGFIKDDHVGLYDRIRVMKATGPKGRVRCNVVPPDPMLLLSSPY